MAHCIRYTSIALVLRLLSFGILFAQVHTGHKKSGNKVLLLLLDGMRWDLFGAEMPAMKKVQENGVRLDWVDTVFPTLSSPSMFSIATGLYPESHNIVHNKIFTTTEQVTFHWNEAFTDPKFAYWWDQPGVEPAWVTAVKQGLKAGSIAYPGGELPIHDTVPTKFVTNKINWTLKERIDTAMAYFEEDDFELVFLYWVDPDETLHNHGIDSPNMYQTLQEIDEGVRYLFEQISEGGLEDVLDVLITSDHGMTQCNERLVVQLYDDKIIDPQDVQFITGYGSMLQIEPQPGKLDKVMQDLQYNTPVFHAYKRDEMDKRFHYGGSKRNLQIIGIPDPGWGVTTDPNIKWGNANHGYDNKLMDMKSILFAQGTSIKKGYRARNMESVNIYPLICEILHLDPSPNNGSREHYQDMLALITPSTEEPAHPTHPTQPTQPIKMPTPPRECGTPQDHTLTVRTLSLVIMCLSISSLVLGVTTIYYCGRYGLCKNGLFSCCRDDEYRSHTGFISLANDIDLDDEDEV
ncbi:ectonucleotide pyrophosphatase/phosphodiesterase family member 7-like [Amphiura filiformis]|uniref:ectonucleotide pyrophosphatase/phosphodiesterase family member 7-like n=1 Tax=Amphiura filiformis TaxID=82378 RepID=UPI003B220603